VGQNNSPAGRAGLARSACHSRAVNPLIVLANLPIDRELFPIYSHIAFRRVNQVRERAHEDQFMSQHIRLQTFLPYPIAEWVKTSAADHGESVSIFIRDLIVAAFQREMGMPLPGDRIDRIERHGLFVSIALDALLSAQPDTSLRQRTHEAYARKVRPPKPEEGQ
jgi:hypothetical protein